MENKPTRVRRMAVDTGRAWAGVLVARDLYYVGSMMQPISLNEKQTREATIDALSYAGLFPSSKPERYPIAKLFPDSLDYHYWYSEHRKAWVVTRNVYGPMLIYS